MTGITHQAGAMPDDYSKARARGLAGGKAILVRYLVVGLLSLGGSTFLIRTLGPADWASFSVAYYLIVFIDQHLPQRLLGRLIQVSRPPSQVDLQAAARLMQLVGLALAAFFSAIAIPAAALYGDEALAPCLFGTAVCAYVYSVRSTSVALLERDLRYQRIVLADVLDQVTFYAIAIPAVAFGTGLEGMSVALALRGLLSAGLLRRSAPAPFFGRANVDARRSILAFGVPSALASLIYLGDGLVPIVVLGGDHAEELAFTMTAGTIIGYAATVQVAVQRVSFPSLALLQRQRSRFVRAVRGTLRVSNFAIVSTLVPVAASSPVWLPALLGPEWRPASLVMMVIAGGLMINSVNSVVLPALSSLGFPRSPLRLQVGMTGTYLVLAFPAAAISPLLGPAVAWTVSRAVGSAASIIALHRHGLPIPWMAEVGILGASLAAIGLIGGLLYEGRPVEALSLGIGLGIVWAFATRREAKVAIRLARTRMPAAP
jgi:O-antigen/teichoic acid export membrane protein